MIIEYDENNPLKKKVQSAINRKLDTEKDCIQMADLMSPMLKDLDINKNIELKLRRKLEEKDLKLSKDYLAEFEKITRIVHTFDEIAKRMNRTCTKIHKDLEKAKNRNDTFMKTSSDLNERKLLLESKFKEIDGFIEKFSLTESQYEELRNCEENGRLTFELFSVLERAQEIRTECKRLINEEPSVALFEMMDEMQVVLNRGDEIICSCIKREVPQISIDVIQTGGILPKAFKILQTSHPLLRFALDQVTTSRSQQLLNKFVNFVKKQSGEDSVNSVTDLLTFVHSETENEKEIIDWILSQCEAEISFQYASTVLNESLASIPHPFKIQIEKLLGNEKSVVKMCEIGKILMFFDEKFRKTISNPNKFSTMLEELSKVVRQVTIAGIHHNVEILIMKMSVPKKDLLPDPTIYTFLKLFQDLIDCSSSGDEKFLENEEILQFVIDPLLQNIQISATWLVSNIDVPIFTINCLTTIRNAIEGVDGNFNRMEMIQAMIDSNGDVLVSERVAEMLEQSNLISIYHLMVKAKAEKKSLPTVDGLKFDEITNSLLIFTEFLHLKSEVAIDPEFSRKLLCSKENLKVREKIVSEFMKVYGLIAENLEEYENLNYLSVDSVAKLLKCENSNRM